MKKVLATLLALLCLTAIAACKPKKGTSDTSTPSQQITFTAKILELRDDVFLARPVNSETMRDVFLVEAPAPKGLKLSLGNYVNITCDITPHPADNTPMRLDGADVIPCDKSTSDVPQLRLLPLYTAEQLSVDMQDITEAQIHKAWGAPYTSFSGMYGDIYYTDISRRYEVVLYYKLSAPPTVESVRCREVADAPTVTQYRYDGNGAGGDFVITLYSDGKFQYHEGVLSSYIGMGKWTKDENGVICLSDQPISNADGTSAFVRRNYFTMEGTRLVWKASQSNGFLYVNVKNGDTWAKLS